MNYTEAAALCYQGKNIRLSDWLGYWFMRDGKILVHTKEGEILETPNIERYKDRGDWQEAGDTFGYEVAILSLINEKKVRRDKWPEGEYMLMHTSKIYFEHFIPGRQHPRKIFSIDIEDQLARDWRVVHN